MTGLSSHIASKSIPLQTRNNLSVAQQWLQTCIAEHRECRQSQRSISKRGLLPTRLLQVIGEEEVKLRCAAFDGVPEYVALSHIWSLNRADQLCLVGAKLQEFQDGVDWDQIPPLYREAVHVTRSLGHQYLWIDSMCIIQDSRQDWLFESRRMAAIYGNAICNLSFLSPDLQETGTPEVISSNEAIFVSSDANTPEQPYSRRDVLSWSSCLLRSPNESVPGVYAHYRREPSNPPPLEDQTLFPWLEQRNWPLFSRAWAFQEYLLAPRILLYGQTHMMWQCNCVFYDEVLGPLIWKDERPASGPGRDMRLKTQYFSNALYALSRSGRVLQTYNQSIGESAEGYVGGQLDPCNLTFMQEYTTLIQDYRLRDLTYAEDRIVAFSGIAEVYSRLGGLTYLAGLWKDLLPLSLI